MERFGITVSGQRLELIRFAVVGITLGAWYDVFRLLRLVVHPRPWRIFFQDLLFFASAAAVTLLAALPISSGVIRPSHLLALVVGFTVYYHTVGRLLYQTMRLFVRFLEELAHKLACGVRRLTEPFLRFTKKVLQICKNRLQVDSKV